LAQFLVDSSFKSIVKALRGSQDSFIAVKPNDVAGSFKDCGAVTTLRKMFIQRRSLFGR
jgi:hypothetical protein